MEKKKELIYQLIINDTKLTTSNLEQLGLSKNEISEMVELSFIKQESENEYSLVSIKQLYNYGLKLIITEHINEANRCFRKCYELEPNNREYILQLMIATIKQDRKEDLFKYFSLLDTEDCEKNIKDNNLYLYLLSLVMKIPYEYHTRVKQFNYDDLLFSNKCEFDNKEKENNIRTLIIKNKYKYALKLLNDSIMEDIEELSKKIAIKELLIKVIEYETKFKYDLLMFAERKEYSKIIDYLKAKSKKRRLRSDEVYILFTVQGIIKILETGKVPEITKTCPKSMYEALKANNYIEAYIFNEQYESRNKTQIGTTLLSILLSDILTLIAKTEQDKEFGIEEGPTLIKTLN